MSALLMETAKKVERRAPPCREATNSISADANACYLGRSQKCASDGAAPRPLGDDKIAIYWPFDLARRSARYLKWKCIRSGHKAYITLI